MNQTEQIIQMKSGKWLMVNWERLARYSRGLNQRVKLEIAVGRVISVIGIIIAGISLLTIISKHRNLTAIITSTGSANLILWVCIIVITWGLYMQRNRQKFLSLELQRNLFSFNGEEDLYWEQLLDYRVLEDLDFEQERGLITENAFNASISSNKILQYYQRLGLNDDNVKQLSSSLSDNINTKNLITQTVDLAWTMKATQVSWQHIHLALLFSVFQSQLLKFGITREDLTAFYEWVINEELAKRYKELWMARSPLKPDGGVNRAYTSVYTPELNKYAIDLTHKAATGKYNLLIARKQQIEELLVKLRNTVVPAVLIVAKQGIGKSRMLEHLAVRMVVEDVPMELSDKRLIQFDFHKALTSLPSFEDFRALLSKVINEVAQTKDIVLVLEDVDLLMKLRPEQAQEIFSAFTNLVQRYRVQLIATTDQQVYEQFVQSMPSILQSFAVQRVPEPPTEIALQILLDSIPGIESKFQVRFTYDAVKLVTKLAYRYDQDRAMPGKGIKLLEDIAIAAQTSGLANISETFVSGYISKIVGASVGEVSDNEAEKLINLEQSMEQRIVGQENAIKAIGSALRRARAGLSKPNKPVASFLFYGPTGVGKTEVAKTLAEVYYGSENAMIRLDMSEFQEDKNLGRLIGEMHDGKFVGGQLTELVRQRPFSLILLDELEKANSKVFDLFLQLLDEGQLTDGMQRKIDFTNTIIIATSNAGSREIAEMIEKGDNYDQVYQATNPSLRQVFKVEFLNRFDQVIMFQPLTSNEVSQIVQKFLRQITKRLLEQGINIEFGPDLISELGKLGYNPIYGAREISRIIQDKVENQVADLIIRRELTSGRTLVLQGKGSYLIS